MLKTFRPLFPLLKKHAAVLTAGFLFMFVQNWALSLVPGYVRRTLDELGGANRGPLVWKYLAIGTAFMLLAAVGMFLMRKFIIGVSRHVEYGLRKAIYEKLIGLDSAFYQANQTGDLTSRATNDLEQVRTLLGPGLMYIPNTVSRLAFFAPAMFALSPGLSLALFAQLAALVLAIFLVLPRMRPLYQRVQEQTGAVSSRAWQLVSGMATLKLFSREKVEEARFAELNREYLKRSMGVAIFTGWSWPFFFAMFTAGDLLILYFGGRSVIQGRLSLGELLQFSVMMGVLTFPVLSLGWVMSMLQQGVSAMARIRRILDAEPVRPTRADGVWAPVETRSPEIELRALSYSYPKASKPSLEGVSARIRPGETLGITGPVGCGKSTLAGLISGTLRAPPGALFINGTDASEADPEEFFRLMAVVPQETFLFSKSMRANIALGEDDEVDEARLMASSRAASLDREIAGLAKGYDEIIGERGITLSGGQKQRMAIARALYKRAPLLLFDDALSAVDSRTEQAILEALRAARMEAGNQASGIPGPKTLVLVSHRISALRLCDRILVLDQGRLVEEGGHEALLARGGLYARLARIQRMEEEVVSPEAASHG
ncbi:MAG: ABC transporter ATP-binding protein [Spirochaetes bacterium]|nr:ABC transporter ATP-binding protein [Spirochaetota bacterium]